MPQLLEKLTAQAKLEAREGLRKSILSLNGLAGLYILKFEVLYKCWLCVYGHIHVRSIQLNLLTRDTMGPTIFCPKLGGQIVH